MKEIIDNMLLWINILSMAMNIKPHEARSIIDDICGLAKAVPDAHLDARAIFLASVILARKDYQAALKQASVCSKGAGYYPALEETAYRNRWIYASMFWQKVATMCHS